MCVLVLFLITVELTKKNIVKILVQTIVYNRASPVEVGKSGRKTSTVVSDDMA